MMAGGARMKVIGIVGYKKSGKTMLVVALARELIGRGYRVATVKHASEGVDLPERDTAKHREVVEQVGAISSEESAIFFNGPMPLEEMLSHVNADIVLVEGFKEEKTFPKMLCLSGREEDQELLDGLLLCAVGTEAAPDAAARLGVPVLDPEREIGAIADLAENRAFKLPNLNCEGCGYTTCYDLARAIVRGEAKVEDCVSLYATTEVRIQGERLALNPFISNMVGSTLRGMLSTLRGFREGTIEIRIGVEGAQD